MASSFSEKDLNFLAELGLSNAEIRVYSAILGHGMLTIGEISTLTKLDLDVVTTAIADLMAIKMVRPLKGALTRYYATLPFLHEFIIAEKDFLLSLTGLRGQLETIHQVFVQKKKDLIGDVIPKSSKEFSEQMEQILIEPVKTVAISAKETIDQTLSELEALLSQTMAKDLENLLAKLAPAVDYVEVLSQTFQQLNAQGETLVSQLLTQYAAKLAAGLKKLRGEFEKYVDQSVNILKKVNEEIEATIEEYISKTASLLKEHEQTFIRFQTKLEGVLVQGKETLQQIETAFKQTDHIDERINHFVGEFNVATEKRLESLQKNLRDVLEGLSVFEGVKELTKIRNSIEMTYSELLGIKVDAAPLGDQIKNEIAKSLGELADQIEKTLSQLFSAIDNIEVEKRAKEIAEILSKLESVTASLSGKLRSKAEELMEQASHEKEEITKIIETTLNDLKGLSAEYREKIDAEVIRLNENYKARAEKMKEAITELIKQFNEKASTELLRHNQEIIGKHSELSNIFTSVIETSDQVLHASLENARSSMIQSLEETVKQIGSLEQQYTKQLEEALLAFLTLFNAKYREIRRIAEKAEEFKFEMYVDTWGVMGIDEAKAVITDMILRTKRQCTIILPELMLNLIDHVRKKRMIRIELVTDLDPNADASLITKLKQRGNVTLRQYRKKDFMACIRDDDEAMICSFDEKGGVSGIKTIDDNFVAILRMVIRDTIIRDSKSI